MSRLNRQYGLNLIELMVTLAILGIIISAATGSFSGLFANKSVGPTVKLFEDSISMARREALKTGSRVEVSPLVDDVSSGVADWTSGWAINRVDVAADGTETTTLIRQFPALNLTAIFTSSDYTQSNPLTLLPAGRVQNTGRFDMYSNECTGEQRYDLNVLISGMISRSRTLCP